MYCCFVYLWIYQRCSKYTFPHFEKGLASECTFWQPAMPGSPFVVFLLLTCTGCPQVMVMSDSFNRNLLLWPGAFQIFSLPKLYRSSSRLLFHNVIYWMCHNSNKMPVAPPGFFLLIMWFVNDPLFYSQYTTLQDHLSCLVARPLTHMAVFPFNSMFSLEGHYRCQRS